MSVLFAGETCWRVGPTRGLAFLIDNEAYYVALLEALESARRSIWILGWAFDPRTRLAPDGQEGPRDPDEIGEILIRLADRKPGLDVRVLIWKSALSINGSHALFEHRARKAFHGTRVRYREDGKIPFGACHHQKVVVIDDEIAFCGGGDIAVNRWDSVGHVHADPRRILPHRARHAPRHDVMVLVEGAGAATLGELFRGRWALAMGERLPPSHSGTSTLGLAGHPEPGSMVAVARTQPAFGGSAMVQEILALRLAAIAAARRTIYFENQYLTSHLITEALVRRLEEPDGPEVVLVLAARSPSWFDRMTMDPARSPLIHRLRSADKHGRFRAYAPDSSGGEAIIVHSKLDIFDDRLACVGSANLNNRSEGFDTECAIAIDDAAADAQGKIIRFRDQLLSHFLGVSEAAFAAARQGSTGLIAAIEAMNGAGRLRPLDVKVPGWWERFVSRRRLGDPADSSESWRFFKPKRRGPGQTSNVATHAELEPRP